MKILLVDDSPDSRMLLRAILKKAGDYDIELADSAEQAYEILKLGTTEECGIDIILLDLVMPNINGIEACKQIKADPKVRDIPVVMVTASNDENDLEEAFQAGAIDYVTKPVSKVELRARVNAIISLKKEMDRRKDLLARLEEANKKLQLLSSLDGLTGLANRRHFDESLEMEWRRAMRQGSPIAVIMCDIDHFKNFNDTYGHQKGDECLKQVGEVLKHATKRPGDLAARYGGEEFVIILPETDTEDALEMGERLRREVEAMAVKHESSSVSDVVTLSLGVATTTPQLGDHASHLLEEADKALYQAKRDGRNRVKKADEVKG